MIGWLERWWPRFGDIGENTRHTLWGRIAWEWCRESKPHLVIMIPGRWRFRIRHRPKAYHATLAPHKQRIIWSFERKPLYDE